MFAIDDWNLCDSITNTEQTGRENFNSITKQRNVAVRFFLFSSYRKCFGRATAIYTELSWWLSSSANFGQRKQRVTLAHALAAHPNGFQTGVDFDAFTAARVRHQRRWTCASTQRSMRLCSYAKMQTFDRYR